MTTFMEDPALLDICPQLEDIRKAGIMPDVIIRGLDGGEVYAHRIMLGARFPYLRSILSGPVCQNNSCLYWPRISTSTIESIVSFAYTGKITITEENYLAIYLLSLNLHSNTVQNYCIEYLKTYLCVNNMHMLWDLSKIINSLNLRELCLHFMKSNLDTIMQTEFFYKMCVSDVTDLLSLADFAKCGEESTFLALCEWINWNEHGRKDSLAELIKLVTWNRVSASFIAQQLELNPVVQNNEQAKLILTEALAAAGASPETEAHVEGPSTSIHQGDVSSEKVEEKITFL